MTLVTYRITDNLLVSIAAQVRSYADGHGPSIALRGVLHKLFDLSNDTVRCCLCIVQLTLSLLQISASGRPVIGMHVVHLRASGHESLFSTATSVLVPRPLHFVPAPACCEISDGISLRIFAIQFGSVSGVRSSRFGSRCGTQYFSNGDKRKCPHVPSSPNHTGPPTHSTRVLLGVAMRHMSGIFEHRVPGIGRYPPGE